jgi:hypothetical protein
VLSIQRDFRRERGERGKKGAVFRSFALCLFTSLSTFSYINSFLLGGFCVSSLLIFSVNYIYLSVYVLMAQQGLCILVPWSIVEREREGRGETKGRLIIEEHARGILGTRQEK